MCKKIKNVNIPGKVMDEMNISSKILRDLFDESFTSILVDDEALHIQIKDYVQKIAPKKESIVKLYKSKIPKKILKSWIYVKGAKHEVRETRSGHQFNYDEGAIPFPDNLKSPSRTMLTSEGSKSPNRISHVIKDPNTKKHRVLTPIECEKLNGFKKTED